MGQPGLDPIRLVEDDAGIALLVVSQLQGSYPPVEHVTTGAAALAWLLERRTRLVLLDYSLTDMNALSLLSGLQSSNVVVPPFIVTTGAGDERVAAEMLRRGARDYVIKDAHFLDNLVNAVGRVLRELETEEKLAAAQAELRRMNEELEQRVAERTADLLAANRSLEQAARIKDEFLAAMSHELRTPLTGIIGMADALALQEQDALTERQIHYVHTIHTAGHRLLNLVNSLLLYARVQAGAVLREPEVTDLDEMCRISLAKVEAETRQRHLHVHYTIHPHPILLVVDVDSLLRILGILLDNAAKFTPEGGAIHLDVQGDAECAMVTVTVADTGIGISEADQARLFKPFTQVDSSLTRQFVGAGLGLAIAHGLVKLLSGVITVESELDCGSRFTFTLPWRTLPEVSESPR
ncbi:MAG: response regulator [Anaerolineales bacterium]|nr:response regulator [Anaerolineales bacterium]